MPYHPTCFSFLQFSLNFLLNSANFNHFTLLTSMQKSIVLRNKNSPFIGVRNAVIKVIDNLLYYFHNERVYISMTVATISGTVDSSSKFGLSLIASKPSHWCLIGKSIQSFLARFWFFAVIRDLIRESYITESETALWNWKYLVCWIVSGMVSFLRKLWLSLAWFRSYESYDYR